jgi:hypothetical protein
VYYDYVHGKVHWISTELEIKINEQDIYPACSVGWWLMAGAGLF